MRAPGPLTEPVDSYGLTGRELDTLLAALRLWQLLRRAPPGACAIPPECLAIAANGRRPLDETETEALDERPYFAGFAESARRWRTRP
mgnify:FL=1